VTISSGAIAKGWRLLAIRAVTILLIVLMSNDGASAYSVLTHEETLDLLWTDAIQPLLLDRYPALSEDQKTKPLRRSLEKRKCSTQTSSVNTSPRTGAKTIRPSNLY